LQWQFFVSCITSTILTGLSSLWGSGFFLFLVWPSQKLPARTAIRVCTWTSFESPRNSGRN
jgi:hypothetical protein